MNIIKMKKQKETKDLAKALKSSLVEKDVENAYRSAFESTFPGCISSPDKCDGLLKNHVVSSLLEFKYNLNLRNHLEQTGVLVQSLYYLKKMELRGEIFPKTIFIGDINECFCIPVNSITKYLSYQLDWTIPPSMAASKNAALVAEMAQDETIYPFIYDIDEKFDFLSVIEKMKNISLDKPYAVAITKINIVEIFRRFERDVIKDKKLISEQALKEDENKRISELVDLFFTCLTSPKDAYLHPNKKDVVVVRGEEVKVNAKNYRIFFSQFRQEYKPSELEEITANKDRILEDTYRRFTGAFFTPDIWVAEAHKMIAEQFGDNWKEEYIVWDCAAGTANLTRGYKFKELYISTLDQSDINTIKDCGYNQEATIFQYDFLDEVGIDRCPENLKKAFESGKKILFFINPPYGTSSNIKQGSKKGLAFTKVHTEMKKNNLGDSIKQIYAQFLWKIINLNERNKNISISTFCPLAFLTGQKFKNFRKTFFNFFSYKDGMMFRAGHFSEVKNNWPICFTLWDGNKNIIINKFKISMKDIGDNFKLDIIGEKILYNVDNIISLNKWARLSTKGMKCNDAPQLSSYCSVKQIGYGKIINESLGYIFSGTNIVENNITHASIFSSTYSGSNSNGFSILPENFNKVVALFTARKTIVPNWINCKDEYLIPNTEHPDYSQWNNDCIIYSLFNNSSQQSSLRNITYKNKKWDIINHFFFMSNEEMRELADTNKFNEMYQDSKTFSEDRYVYNLLKSIPELSPDAKEILELAKDLIRKSMSMRILYHENHPEYHLNAWDSSFAQLKNLWKEYFKDDYSIFKEKYKKFENRMREGVYKFGFLKN